MNKPDLKPSERIREILSKKSISSNDFSVALTDSIIEYLDEENTQLLQRIADGERAIGLMPLYIRSQNSHWWSPDDQEYKDIEWLESFLSPKE